MRVTDEERVDLLQELQEPQEQKAWKTNKDQVRNLLMGQDTCVRCGTREYEPALLPGLCEAC